MESTIILSVSAVVGFAVYYELINVTYLETVNSNGLGVSTVFEIANIYEYDICFSGRLARNHVATGPRLPELAVDDWCRYWSNLRRSLHRSHDNNWN